MDFQTQKEIDVCSLFYNLYGTVPPLSPSTSGTVEENQPPMISSTDVIIYLYFNVSEDGDVDVEEDENILIVV